MCLPARVCVRVWKYARTYFCAASVCVHTRVCACVDICEHVECFLPLCTCVCVCVQVRMYVWIRALIVT